MRWEARKFLADLERCRKLNRYGGFDIELLEKECLFGTAVIFLAIFTVSRLYFFSSEETGYSMLLSVSIACRNSLTLHGISSVLSGRAYWKGNG